MKPYIRKAGLALATAILFLSLVVVSAWQAQAQEIAHLKFNDNLNDSGRFAIHHGSYNNGTNTTINPTYSNGKINKALTLSNQQQKVTLANPESLLLNWSNLNYTISLWFQLTDGLGSDNWGIFNKKSAASGFDMAVQNANPGKIIFSTGTGGVVSSAVIAEDTWYFLAFTQNTTHYGIFINGSLNAFAANSSACCNNNSQNDFQIGYTFDLNRYIASMIDDLRVYNISLSQKQINDIYNFGFGSELSVNNISTVINVTAVDSSRNFSIAHFAVNLTQIASGQTINNSNTNNGTVMAPAVRNATWQVTFWNNTNYTTTSYNITTRINSNSENITLNITPQLLIRFIGNISNNNTNWVRNLTLNITLNECSGWANVGIFVNGILNKSSNVSCSNNLGGFNESYQNRNQEVINISFRKTGANTSHVNTTNQTFRFDVSNPATELNLTTVTGFYVNGFEFNFSLRCTDSAFNNLTYNLSSNGVLFYRGNLSNDSTIRNYSNSTVQDNKLIGGCSDLFGSTTTENNWISYAKQVILWNEITDIPFNISNLSQAKVWFGDNSSSYDLKANNRGNVSFFSDNSSKVRIELEYFDGLNVVRYLDAKLLNESQVKVCAFDQGKSANAPLIFAASAKPATIKNAYSACYSLADYLRFAYQNVFSTQVVLTNSLYYLTTVDSEGRSLLLGSLDGNLVSEINLDILEFGKKVYRLGINKESLTFQKTNESEIQIYYSNLGLDNDFTNVNIVRLDTSENVLSVGNFSNPNEFTIVFNFLSLTNITNATSFEIRVTTVRDGVSETFKKFFNVAGKLGSIPAGVAALISFIFVIFGMTFASARLTMGWFGIVIMAGGIFILSIAVPTWYTGLLMAIEAVMLIYVILLTVRDPTGQLS